MSISIASKLDNNTTTKIFFQVTQPSGRKTDARVTVTEANARYNEPAFINIPASGDIQVQDIDDFIKVLELAKMIAAGEIDIL